MTGEEILRREEILEKDCVELIGKLRILARQRALDEVAADQLMNDDCEKQEMENAGCEGARECHWSWNLP